MQGVDGGSMRHGPRGYCKGAKLKAEIPHKAGRELGSDRHRPSMAPMDLLVLRDARFIKSIWFGRPLSKSTIIAYETATASLCHISTTFLRGSSCRAGPACIGSSTSTKIPRPDKAAGRVLDQPGLPHSAGLVPNQGPLRHAGDCGQHTYH